MSDPRTEMKTGDVYALCQECTRVFPRTQSEPCPKCGGKLKLYVKSAPRMADLSDSEKRERDHSLWENFAEDLNEPNY